MKKKYFALPAAGVAIFSPVALAATQGELGATSSGSISISLSVSGRVQIGGLSDVNFVAVSSDADASSAQSLCVWSNTATRGYSVTATGNGPGGSFALTNGAATAPYGVAWSGTAGQGSGTRLSSGTALTGLTSVASSPDCSSGAAATSSLVVSLEAADLKSVQPETSYAGTLSLLVAPE